MTLAFLSLVALAEAVAFLDSAASCTELDAHRKRAVASLLSLAEMVDPSPMCMDMCKNVGACPVPAGENVDCNCFACSGFDKDAYASANDGIMTWDELITHMDDLGMKWRDAIKQWHKKA